MLFLKIEPHIGLIAMSFYEPSPRYALEEVLTITTEKIYLVDLSKNVNSSMTTYKRTHISIY